MLRVVRKPQLVSDIGKFLEKVTLCFETTSYVSCNYSISCFHFQIQFVLVSTHIVIQTYSSQCPMHGGTYWIGLSNLVLFGILFADFYRKRYGLGVSTEKVLFACVSRRDD